MPLSRKGSTGMGRGLAFSLIFAISGCTYSLTGFFPSEYRDVALAKVDNKTDYLQMTTIAEDAFDQFVIRDSRLRLKDVNGANVLSYITVERYDRQPEQYSPDGNIEAYRYTVNLSVKFVRKGDTTALVGPSRYSGVYVLSALESPDSAYRACINEALAKAFSDYFNRLSRD